MILTDLIDKKLADVKELVYAFIPRFRCLYQVNLNFDSEYSINYDPASKYLSIERARCLPTDFWYENVSSVSVIAGKNGAGKSSVLKWILERIVEGYPVDKLDGIIIISDNGKLKVFHDVDIDLDRDILAKNGIDVDPIDVRGWNQDRLRSELAIPSIFCAGHFDVYLDESPSCKELNGERNISDRWLLIHDMDSYRKIDGSNRNYALTDYYDAYTVENDIRICELLMDGRFQELFKDNGRPALRLPRYIVLRPNTAGDVNIRARVAFLRDNYIHKEGNPDFQKEAEKEYRLLKQVNEVAHNYFITQNEENAGKRLLADFLFASLKGFYYEFVRQESFDADVVKFGLKLFTESYRKADSSVLEWIKSARNEIANRNSSSKGKGFLQIEGFYRDLEKALTFIAGLKWKEGLPVIDCASSVKDAVFKPPHGEQIYADMFTGIGKTLRDTMISRNGFSDRFFDICYTHNLKRRSELSSGELAMLNLYSRIKYAMESPMLGGAYEKPVLMLLDEVEMGFHPEWQRQFINKLTQFVSKIIRNGSSMQIIYTTHSPITLSDMPKECVNLLKHNGSETVNESSDKKKETFGANVFDLYGDSFFMENGLIGEFASEKIKALNTEIEGLVAKSETGEMDVPINKQQYKDYVAQLRKRVDLIGDNRIRAYLNSRLDRVDPLDEIRRLKKRIEMLETQISGNNEEN